MEPRMDLGNGLNVVDRWWHGILEQLSSNEQPMELTRVARAGV